MVEKGTGMVLRILVMMSLAGECTVEEGTKVHYEKVMLDIP